MSSMNNMNISDIDINEYSEPTYNHITKREFFDEDNIKYLLADERFNKEDRKHLSHYNKHRISGSKLNCSYKFANGCEELQLGRLFPDDGIGLQSFRFDIRNPLTKKYYWDLDFENAHYRIAEKYCIDYGINHDNISYYVNNREKCLTMISANRKKAKTEFLKVLYGGDIKLYKDAYTEVDGFINVSGFNFLKDLEKEVNVLSTIIWDKYKQYHSLKVGKEKISIEKKRNPKYSLMSLIFQTEERKLLMILDWFLSKRNRYMGIFIHDGGLIEKIQGETYFPNELIVEATAIVNTISGYNMKLSIKEISYEWTPYKPQESQYDIMKREFEEKNFLVGSVLYSIHSDGYTQPMKIYDAKVKFGNKIIEMWDETTQSTKKRKFLDMWLEDKDRLQYERADFYPDRKKCPPGIYNLFQGFNAEKFKPDKELLWDDIINLIEPITNHLNLITSGYAERIHMVLANIIQAPDVKTGVAVLIRDIGGLFKESGGLGKNLIFEWFGNEILGEKYFVVVGDNRELYGSFNSLFEAKLLTLVEEASGKENHMNNDMLKSKITSKKTNINKKTIAQYEVADYNRFIFCSNNRNPLPIKQGSRRYEVYDSNPVKRNNVEYFNNFAKHINKPIVKWAYYTYLKSINIYRTPIEYQSTIPVTPAYRDIRYLNAPIYHKWLVHCIRTNTLEDGYTSDLYKGFLNWIQENKERSYDNVITQTAFGKLLMDATEVRSDMEGSIYNDYELDNQGRKHKSHGSMYMCWNKQELIKALKTLCILEDDFEIKL